MTAVPVPTEFVESANPRQQLHDEAEVEGGSFLETSDGWICRTDDRRIEFQTRER